MSTTMDARTTTAADRTRSPAVALGMDEDGEAAPAMSEMRVLAIGHLATIRSWLSSSASRTAPPRGQGSDS